MCVFFVNYPYTLRLSPHHIILLMKLNIIYILTAIMKITAVDVERNNSLMLETHDQVVETIDLKELYILGRLSGLPGYALPTSYLDISGRCLSLNNLLLIVMVCG